VQVFRAMSGRRVKVLIAPTSKFHSPNRLKGGAGRGKYEMRNFDGDRVPERGVLGDKLADVLEEEEGGESSRSDGVTGTREHNTPVVESLGTYTPCGEGERR